jgi:hypothetical protein
MEVPKGINLYRQVQKKEETQGLLFPTSKLMGVAKHFTRSQNLNWELQGLLHFCRLQHLTTSYLRKIRTEDIYEL